MSETTNSATDQTTDDRARTWAFTGLALGLAGLMGGGALTNGIQMLFLDQLPGGISSWSFALALATAPFVLGVLGLWLGGNAAGSSDALARPVGRAAQTVSGIAILGAVLVLIATLTRDM